LYNGPMVPPARDVIEWSKDPKVINKKLKIYHFSLLPMSAMLCVGEGKAIVLLTVENDESKKNG